MQKYAATFEFDEDRAGRTIRIDTLLGELKSTSFPYIADVIDAARSYRRSPGSAAPRSGNTVLRSDFDKFSCYSWVVTDKLGILASSGVDAIGSELTPGDSRCAGDPP
ncbi:hypothetical protein GCM10009020_22020 [Natronoarchaeum mannanilyticum]|uniref:Uncharacterized protein n=1 Tax=Natronoarchaeum mannanilyticum TaxID=926360 RepID=A0AAV3T9Z2_9EURY